MSYTSNRDANISSNGGLDNNTVMWGYSPNFNLKRQSSIVDATLLQFRLSGSDDDGDEKKGRLDLKQQVKVLQEGSNTKISET